MRIAAAILILAALTVAAACQDAATLEVSVHGQPAGLPLVSITVRGPSGSVLATGRTPVNTGSLVFHGLPVGQVVVEALLLSEDRAGYAARHVVLRPGANTATFEIGRDLVLTPLVRAQDPPPQAPPESVLSELEADRRVAAILEFDRVEGVPELTLAADTSAGRLTLESVLAEAGLEVTTVWSDVIPRAELGDGWPGEARLAESLARHRNAEVPADAWHLHLLLAPQPEPDLELSLVVDPQRRSGAVVFLAADASRPEVLHAVLHELGHLLNLPHPWDLSADEPTVMSYPWRWPGWSWEDPAVFRFGPSSRHHLLRAPEACVRPGAGPFGACWSSTPHPGS